MESINCSVHFLTLKQIGYEESNVAVTFYHDRTHFDPKQKNLYAQYAEEFNLQQGRHFVLHNRIATVPNKMSKLKDQVKEFDALLSSGIKIIKTLWLNQNRILLVTITSTLIWLLIDPTSGDLIKISIDKSLEALKLSSKKLSDFVVMTPDGQKNPFIVISFSDKSKIDILKFKKSNQFFDFYFKLPNVDKLENFDPFVVLNYETTCPQVEFSIQKNILVDPTQEFFTLWWSNQTELVNQRSLLDRDDLRNNILVLSTNLSDPNLLEFMFKSDGLLLECDYIDDSLISVEQIEYTNNQKFSITIFKCLTKNPKNEDNFKPIKVKLKTFYLNSRVNQIKMYGVFVLFITDDQHIVLYDYNKNSITKTRVLGGKKIEWLIENLCFCVTNPNGDLKLFDIGMNEIDLKYATRYFLKFNTLSEYLNENLFLRNGENHMYLFSNSHKSWDSIWSCFSYTKGPFGLFKIDLTHNFSSLDLVNFYLKSYKLSLDFIKKSINLYESLDWNRCPVECLGSLQKIMSILLSTRVNFDTDIESLCERVLRSFYKPKKAIDQDIIIEYRSKVALYSRKFFFQLLKNLRFEKALRLSDDIGDPDLINDLFHCVNDHRQYNLAEICRIKYHELKKEESREKLKAELNRSVNTIDDNLKGNYSEFDRYSVSSSEQSSSIDSYDGSLGSDFEEFECDKKTKFSKRSIKISYDRPKVYTEQEIEDFAKKIIIQNKFVYEAAFN